MPTLAFDADPDTGLPPLLMVHGLMVDRRIWNPNAELSDQFRCIRVDLPAHGQSPVAADSDDTTPTRIVTALDDLRRDLGIARWHVCGQSFGGALVLRYALDFPDQCHKVVFTNANDALVAGADTVDPQGFANLLAGAMPTLSVHHRLGTLHVPTMLVNGVKERKFQPNRDWLAQTHPAIRIVDLEGGHSVNVESPDGFNAAVRAFLAP